MDMHVAWRIACHKVDRFFAERSSPNGRVVAQGRPRVFTASDLLTLFTKMCRTSQPWSAIHPQYKTLHRNFRQLVDGGVFESIQRQIVRIYTSRRSAQHHITDTKYIKNVLGRDVIGRNPTDRGRMATKLSTITDHSGVVLLFALFPGNTSDQRVLPPTLQDFRAPPGMELFADKGYDSRSNRAYITSCGYRDRISRRGQKRLPNGSRKRIRIEHSYARLKQFRHLRDRYDHLATSFRAFVVIANICIIDQELCNVRIRDTL